MLGQVMAFWILYWEWFAQSRRRYRGLVERFRHQSTREASGSDQVAAVDTATKVLDLVSIVSASASVLSLYSLCLFFSRLCVFSFLDD